MSRRATTVTESAILPVPWIVEGPVASRGSNHVAVGYFIGARRGVKRSNG